MVIHKTVKQRGRSIFLQCNKVGGQIVAVTFTPGLNVQSLVSVTGMACTNAAAGKLRCLTAFSFRQMTQHMLGSAIICVLLARALCHLVLLGGVFFLAPTAAEYSRGACASTD